MFIAHRGVVKKGVKENSIEAFKLAILDPYYSGFELDLKESKDHEFVVTHDFIYNNKLINQTNYIELKTMGLVRLEDVLDLDTDKLILIDIKDININVDKLISVISKYHKKIYVMSYSRKLINKLIDKSVNYKMGLLNMIFNSENEYKKYDFITLLNSSVTNNIINYFKTRNKDIFIYGIVNEINCYDYNNYYIIDDSKRNNVKIGSYYQNN